MNVYDRTFISQRNKNKESFALFESALNEADESLLSFKEARKPKGAIPTNIREKKSQNPANFLNEEEINKGKMTVKTNAVKEMLKERRLAEQLRYGAGPEELEAEVIGEFGKSILKICQKHNITGKAIWEAFDILKTYIGDTPNVDEALTNWKKSEDTDNEEELEEDQSYSSKLSKKQKKIKENYLARKTLRSIRKQLAEKKLRSRI